MKLLPDSSQLRYKGSLKPSSTKQEIVCFRKVHCGRSTRRMKRSVQYTPPLRNKDRTRIKSYQGKSNCFASRLENVFKSNMSTTNKDDDDEVIMYLEKITLPSPLIRFFMKEAFRVILEEYHRKKHQI